MENPQPHPHDPSPESIAKVVEGYRREYGVDLTEEQAREVLGIMVRFVAVQVRWHLDEIAEIRARRDAA